MKITIPLRRTLARYRATLLLAVIFLLPSLVTAQSTAGGTVISNQASATYGDGTSSYSTVSNIVTITVANVSGLAITPDGTSIANIVAAETGVQFPFTVTNSSNYGVKVHFLASGASIQTTNGTVTAAFVDYNGNGTYDAGTDLDVFGNGSAVDTTTIAKDASVNVIVVVTISGSLTAGQTVTVQLGDATGGSPSYDNQPAATTAHEVRTNSTGIAPAPVNGESAARGALTSTVDADAALKTYLAASSAGPLGYSADITYTAHLTNTGSRAASTVSLSGNAGVYIVATIPTNTALKAGQSWPAGTLFTADALTTVNLSATYSTTQPTASTVTRVAFKIGSTLAAGATSADFTYIVTINSGPFDSSNGISAYSDAYATNSVGANLTDRSGDDIASSVGAAVVTTITQTGNVLIGTSAHPDASNTTTNDDYTNKSVNTGIAGIVFGGNTNASGTATFTNTLKNTGNANDTFTITAPTVPSGFTVEVSTNAGASYTDVSNGTTSVALAIAYNTTADILVRITAPSGKPVLSSFDTIIRAKSGVTTANTNDTIDRLYTGFVRLTKAAATIVNGTGKGGATDAVPGAVITYSIDYANLASTGGTNCVTLNASSIVITEDGAAGGNNWGASTTQVVGSATDSRSGTITGDAINSTVLTDSIASLPAGQTGTFGFKRTIK